VSEEVRLQSSAGTWRAGSQLDSIDLKFIIRTSPDEPVLVDGVGGTHYLPGDEVFVLLPDELQHASQEIASRLQGYGVKVQALSIVCPPNACVDFSDVLNAIEPLTADTSTLNLHLAHVSSSNFDQMVSNWDQVSLVACELDEGWWIRSRPSYACTYLWLEDCTAVQAADTNFSCGNWRELEWITINELNTNASLGRRPKDPPPEMWFKPEPRVTRKSIYQPNSESLYRTLWGPNVTTLSLHNCRDILFVTESDAIHSLTSLDFSGSPCTNEVLRWICRGSHIYSLGSTKTSEAEMEWSLLGTLPMLTSLDVTCSRFDDADLVEVLACTRLETIHCYYTELTAASWPIVFRSTTLRYVWVSAEMLTGELPNDLPSKTSIEEIVMINVAKEHEAYLRELLIRYPEVRTHSM
jgi:hypothetical protein